MGIERVMQRCVKRVSMHMHSASHVVVTKTLKQNAEFKRSEKDGNTTHTRSHSYRGETPDKNNKKIYFKCSVHFGIHSPLWMPNENFSMKKPTRQKKARDTHMLSLRNETRPKAVSVCRSWENGKENRWYHFNNEFRCTWNFSHSEIVSECGIFVPAALSTFTHSPLA